MNIEKIVITVKKEITETIILSEDTGFDMPETANELVDMVSDAKDSPTLFMCKESTSTEVETISIESDIIESNQQRRINNG